MSLPRAKPRRTPRARLLRLAIFLVLLALSLSLLSRVARRAVSAPAAGRSDATSPSNTTAASASASASSTTTSASLDCAHPERLGDAYGGWYLCRPTTPDGLRGGVVYTVGVGRNIEWDKAMIARYGTVHHGWDPTPTAVDFTSKHPVPDGFVFHPVGLAAEDGNLTLKLPTSNGDSYTVMEFRESAQEGTVVDVPVVALESMLKIGGHQRLAILKIDIEGAEFDVVQRWASDAYVPPVEQLLIEFHERYFQHKTDWKDLVPTAVEQLANLGFVVVRRTSLEITFARKDAMAST